MKPFRFWEQPTFVYLLLAALTILVFLPVRNFEFIGYDDPDYVTQNSWIQRGLTWEGIVRAFRTFDSSNWHPVTWLSNMLDTELTGYTATGPHVTNLLLHVGNSLLLMFLLQTPTGAVWRSAIVAALFALHPLHVESVAWVSERKDVLSTFLGLLCLVTYAKYAKATRESPSLSSPKEERTGERRQIRTSAEKESLGISKGTSRAAEIQTPHPGPLPVGRGQGRAPAALLETSASSPVTRPASRWYWLSLALFALGLMSKPMLVTWPFLMLLLDYWPLQRAGDNLVAWGRLIREKVPFFILSAAGCVITLIAQKQGGAIASTSYLSMPTRIGNSIVSYPRYLKKTLWPTELIIPWPYPKDDWSLALVLGCSILLIALSILAIYFRRRAPFFAGWFWYLGMLVPVIGLLQVGGQSIADRYTYVPLVGFFVAIIWGAAALIERWKLPRALPAAVAILVLGLCVMVTRNQLQYWRNSETLFRHTLSVTPANGVAHLHVGNYLLETGQADQAMEHYLEVLKVMPGNIYALAGIGEALTKTRRYSEAIDFLQTALRNSPDFPKGHFEMGTLYAELGQMDKAMEHFEKAIKLSPENAIAHYRFGNALMKSGQTDEAIAEYTLAHRYQPGNVDTLNNLGAAYLAKRKLDEAAAQFTLALRYQPENLNARFNLGNVYAMQEKWKDASEQYLGALEAAPANAAIQYGCGLAFARLGQRERAIQHLTEALRLNPNDSKARRELQGLQ